MLSSLVKRPFLLSSHTDSHPKTQLQAALLNPQAGPKWLPWEPIPRFTRLCPHATLWYWNQPWSSLLGFMSVLPTPKIFPGQVFSKCSPELNNWMKFPSWALWFNFFHLGGRGGMVRKRTAVHWYTNVIPSYGSAQPWLMGTSLSSASLNCEEPSGTAIGVLTSSDSRKCKSMADMLHFIFDLYKTKLLQAFYSLVDLSA